MKKKSLLLIDGHALAYRYYFALERSGMKTPDNRPIWAVFGFFKCMFDLLKETKANPDLIAVTFDVGRVTYRVDLYPEYKANRESMPDAMHIQLGEIVEGLKAFNIPICTKEGFEADDVIGTIAEKAKSLGISTMILTGDRDSFQLVDDENGVTVIMPSKGEIVTYNRAKVFERMGVYPEQIIDYKGLAGDTSDNIPGIRGIGDKTAVKLLTEYGTLENIYENLENISGKSLKQKLTDGKRDALLSKELATIQRNVDIDFDFDDTCLALPDKNKVLDFFRRNAFYAFLKSSDEILSHFEISDDCKIAKVSEIKKDVKPSDITHPEVPVSETGQLGLFAQEAEKSRRTYSVNKYVVDTEEMLSKLTETLKTKTLFSVDTETTSINPLEAGLVGISIAYNDCIQTKNKRVKLNDDEHDVTESFYIPVGHKNGKQNSLETVIKYLAPIFADEKICKTMQNAKFDLHVLKNHQMTVNGLIFDTMLASYIKDSSRKHGLKLQSNMYLNYIMEEYQDVVSNKFETFDNVEIEKASSYACDDAFATLELTRYWQNQLDEKEIELLYEMEVPTTIVLTEMEENGVSVDKKYLAELSEDAEAKIEEIESKIYAEAGEKFNINSPKQVSEVLFDKMGLKQRGRKKASKSTNAKVMEDLALDYPIAKYILEQRHFSKLKSTYIDVLPTLISKKDNRIHTSFNQTITSTGRLSSSNPNLQNIPVRTDYGAKIRGAFVPKDRDNMMILSADYSQIELRLMAHCSQDENLMQAFLDDVDVHALTASKVYGVPIEDVTKEMRYNAKAVNFGIVYGQSKYGLASQLGISAFEADEFIAKYFHTYPKIKDYMYETIDFAQKNGYVETIYGRKRWLDTGLYSSNMKEREAAQRAAINAPLQGSAADLIKFAMIKLQKSILGSKLSSKIVLQVHDELVLEVVKSEQNIITDLVRDAMEQGQPLTVPLKVDIALGQNLMEL
ncbi:MAG: DNA polymerase I [Candidatus Gastranaerophilales bacterium]|nr:DNA polymerase I [Candidatus Gastranaerophilales bacterium]